MTEDEWAAISLLIDNCWRGDFDETMSASYFSMLGRYESDDVMAALHEIVETGVAWVPSVPEIVASMRRMREPELPPWTEVWDAMQFTLRRCRSEDEAVLMLTENCHPVAAAFMRLEGFERLQHEPFYDPEFGALRQRELAQRWSEYAEASRERIRQGRAIEANNERRRALGQVTAKGLIARLSEPDGTIG